MQIQAPNLLLFDSIRRRPRLFLGPSVVCGSEPGPNRVRVEFEVEQAARIDTFIASLVLLSLWICSLNFAPVYDLLISKTGSRCKVRAFKSSRNEGLDEPSKKVIKKR
jgi:hypothetical protein